MKLSEVAGAAVSIALVTMFLVVGLRGCASSAWVSGEDPRQYSFLGEDNVSVVVLVLPNNKVLLWYANPMASENELALVWWRGLVGDHYGLGIWNFEEAPVPGPNWRIFPRGFEPVFMDIDVLEKHREGTGDPVFPDEGDRSREFVLFSPDDSRIRFAGMDLRRTEINPLLVAHFRNVLIDQRSREALDSLPVEQGPYDPLLASEAGLSPTTREAARALFDLIVRKWASLAEKSTPSAKDCQDPDGLCFETFRMEVRPGGLGIIRHVRLMADLKPDHRESWLALAAPDPGYQDHQTFCKEPLLSLMSDFDVQMESRYYSFSGEPLFENVVGAAQCKRFEELAKSYRESMD